MLATIAVALVALLHVFFMLLEMLLWKKPVGRRISGMGREHAEQTAVLAANQGLYNGFIAAALLLGLTAPERYPDEIVFVLGCVVVAGVFGALTASRTIFWLQAVPALLALVLWQAGI